jgi:hypothetical protein
LSDAHSGNPTIRPRDGHDRLRGTLRFFPALGSLMADTPGANLPAKQENRELATALGAIGHLIVREVGESTHPGIRQSASLSHC